MRKKDELSNPSSCLNRAADDEPIFVLRANDPSAPTAVAAWAERYMSEKGGIGFMTDEQFAKYGEAMSLARTMRSWRSHHIRIECPLCGRSHSLAVSCSNP